MSKISVVIPLYNKEESIEKTLLSVLNQNFPDFEIIIVNDGSTDASLQKIEQFEDNRIKLFHQDNKGAASARNLGIEKSTSELIAFLDADDIWLPNHLEELHQLYLDFPNCGMYCSRYLTSITENKQLKNNLLGINDNYRGIIQDFFKSSYINRVATSSSVLIPKKNLVEEKGFDAKISSGQDLDLWIKIAIKHKIAINNTVSAVYEYHLPNSLSKTSILKKTLPDFSQYITFERQNPSLKAFLDLYRIEYALNFRVFGAIKKSDAYLKDVTTEIPFKTRLLLKLPPLVLRSLLKLKHWLRSKGIDFTVYH